MTASGNPSPRISFERDTPELAQNYDRTSDHQFEHGKDLISSLAPAPGEHVLDVGAGTGRLAEYVAAFVGPSGRIIAVDPLPLRVELARQRAQGRFDAQVAQAEDLSAFPDESFDVVYLNSVFHWVEDKPRALEEVHRVLKKGGRVGLNTQSTNRPHEIRPLIEQALVAAGVPFSSEQAQPTISIGEAELEALFSTAGFGGYSGTLRAIETFYPEVEELITRTASSSFGNFLNGLSPDEQARLQQELSRLLEPKRVANGFSLTRYLIFATARKPA